MENNSSWVQEWLQEKALKAAEAFDREEVPQEVFMQCPHIEIPVKKPKRGARTAQNLLDDLDNLEITRKPIINEFLYERDIFMMSADSGVGKSTITAQLAASLSSGTPLFGALETRKMRTYVIQVEGDYEESIERLRHMRSVVPIDPKFLCWHENRKLDISHREGIDHAIYEIERVMPEPEVIIIDPIYKLSMKDIATGEGALMVVNFSDALYEKFNCSNVLIHHNTKSDFNIVEGKKESKSDAYYGHSFIKNHIRTSYSLIRSKENDQPILIRKKGRGGDTLHRIQLNYDPMTMTCMVDYEDTSTDSIIRVRKFLESKATLGLNTNFNDVMNNCNISQAQLRRLKPRFEDLITVKHEARNKQIWEPKKPQNSV